MSTMAEPPVVPEQTKDTISLHLRRSHGYDIPYAVAQPPSVLLGEHDRIHQQFDSNRVDHVHA